MEKKIKIPREAKENTVVTYRYLFRHWSESIADKFIRTLNQKILNIQLFPELYPVIDSATFVRKCVVSKQVSIYYKINESNIEIITLFDSR